MIYDDSSKMLAVPELALLTFRRRMEAGMMSALSGLLATVIGVAVRSHMPLAATLILVAIPFLGFVPMWAIFFWRWRCPSKAAIEYFTKKIEKKRQVGASAMAFSRKGILSSGLIVFAFLLALVMAMPL